MGLLHLCINGPDHARVFFSVFFVFRDLLRLHHDHVFAVCVLHCHRAQPSPSLPGHTPHAVLGRSWSSPLSVHSSQSVSQSVRQSDSQSVSISLTHSLTHSLSHSLTHSFTHSLAHSLSLSPITHSLTKHSLNHSSTRSLIRSLTLSPTHSLILSPITHSLSQ